MKTVPREVWHAREAVKEVADKGIDHVVLCVRSEKRQRAADVFEDTLTSTFASLAVPTSISRTKIPPRMPELLEESLRTKRRVVALVEATYTANQFDAVEVLRQARPLAMCIPDFNNRVVPLLVVDKDHAHTRAFYGGPRIYDDGPRELIVRAKSLGIITVPVTAVTLKDDVSAAIRALLKGELTENL